MQKEGYGALTELILEEESIQALNSETLNERFILSKKGEFRDKIFGYAHQLIEADCVVIGAPYWDFGFPAMLKNYIEATSIAGLTYRYGENGKPHGMCRADKMYYVTTCGGYIREYNLGFDTVKAVSKQFGIKDCICIASEGLDIKTNDAEAILRDSINDLPNKL